MKFIKLAIATTLLIGSCASTAANNNIFTSYYGNSPGFGLNYEYNISHNLWLGLGIAYDSEKDDELCKTTVISVPAMANWLWLEGEHKIETGIGLTYISAKGQDLFDSEIKADDSGLIGILSFGYRYMPETKGVSFRVTFNPIITSNRINLGAGLALGFTF